MMAEIVERTDGIPLFVEEMTKAVLEAEGEGEARHIAARSSVRGPGSPCKLARLAEWRASTGSAQPKS